MASIMSTSSSFVEEDDDQPLPSFLEMFGDGFTAVNKGKKKKNGKAEEEVTGRWTPNEHRIFLEGIMLYGRDWKKVQALLKTRNIVQIRTHAQKVFKKCSLNKTPTAGAMDTGANMKFLEEMTSNVLDKDDGDKGLSMSSNGTERHNNSGVVAVADGAGTAEVGSHNNPPRTLSEPVVIGQNDENIMNGSTSNLVNTNRDASGDTGTGDAKQHHGGDISTENQAHPQEQSHGNLHLLGSDRGTEQSMMYYPAEHEHQHHQQHQHQHQQQAYSQHQQEYSQHQHQHQTSMLYGDGNSNANTGVGEQDESQEYQRQQQQQMEANEYQQYLYHQMMHDQQNQHQDGQHQQFAQQQMFYEEQHQGEQHQQHQGEQHQGDQQQQSVGEDNQQSNIRLDPASPLQPDPSSVQ